MGTTVSVDTITVVDEARLVSGLAVHVLRQAVFGVPVGQYLIRGRNMGILQIPQQPLNGSKVGYAAGSFQTIVVGPVRVNVNVGCVQIPW